MDYPAKKLVLRVAEVSVQSSCFHRGMYWRNGEGWSIMESGSTGGGIDVEIVYA